MNYFDWLEQKQGAEELEEIEALCEEWEYYHNQESEWDV